MLGWREVPVNEGACGSAAARCRPADRPAVRRRRRRARRPGRLRAQALRDPPHRRARGPRGPRHPELLQPHDGPEGDAHRAAAAALLPGPARRARGEPARARALALLHEHLPELGARAPVPHARPQRRDQHAARQPQLDARPRAAARLAAVRRRHREDPPAAARRHLRLGLARRPDGAARAGRPLARARDLDADPRGAPGAPRAARRRCATSTRTTRRSSSPGTARRPWPSATAA